MILNQLSYIILAAVIVTAIINMSINNIVNKKNMFSIWQNVYLVYIIFHSIYVFFIRAFFVGDYYLDVGAPFVLFYPPFYYTAVYTLNAPENFNLKKQIQNFYPAFLFVIFFLIICLFLKDNLKLQRLYSITLYSLGCLLFIIYGVLSYVKYNRKSLDPAVAALMRRSLILAVTITLVFSALIIATRKEIINHFNGVVVYLVMFFTVLVLFRYNISMLSERVLGSKIISYENQKEDIEGEETDAPNIDDNKYKKSRITEKELQGYLMKVQKSLDEKIYLESDLTLEKLSKQLNIPKYYLSQVFSLGFQENFNKLINRHRIEFAITLLQDKESNLTIEEIGMESGFNSRSSFYRTFNIYYQISPIDYRKNILENRN